MEYKVGDQFIDIKRGCKVQIWLVTENYLKVQKYYPSEGWILNTNTFTKNEINILLSNKDLIPYTETLWILYGKE